MNTAPEFVHLHLHSQYSLLDGAIRIKELIPRLKESGMTAVAVTDHGNMFSAVDFYTCAISNQIKPIIGCEVYMAPGDRTDRTRKRNDHLVLLARTQKGYQNLKYLVSMGYVEGFYYRPRIDRELLKQHNEGIIGLTACLAGEVARSFSEGGYARSRDTAARLAECFEPGMFFLEVQNNGYPEQIPYNEALRRIGQELNLPLVATNDCHYLTQEDASAHKVLMCIGTSTTLSDNNAKLHYSDELFLRTPAEMAAAMTHYPDAIANTVKIAEMCEEVNPTGPLELPDFPIPEGMDVNQFLRRTAHDMLNRRFEEFAEIKLTVDTSAYRKRLDTELDVICEMGFAGYFLIVMDFIGHAQEQGIPVGPGRGSGAGSLVAYALRITNLDPIPLHLLFERFLNPERISMPDFDIDFCKNRREEVIRYVTKKYGSSNVGQIATFHLLKSRSVVRDVGRVMGMPYAEVDPIAKLVPEGPKVTLASALRDEPRLREARQQDPNVDQLLRYAERLENLNRHAGMHAAGIVIGNRPIWEYVPVFTAGDRTDDSPLISQFDMNYVEKCGLVKFDFLGLKTLTIIDTAIKLINRRPDITTPVNIDRIRLDDTEVYDMIARGDTWGVFQLESSGFQELLRRLKPDCFEDIIAAVALYRPGPLEGGYVDKFIDCKHGRTEITYDHERLEPILKETYGVIVYQEQVMQAAQILAGYSLGQADIMRRAMGKKKADEMAKERLHFVAGCEKGGLTAEIANRIFDLIDKFASYGFNKSHSAAYALIAYQTAWLKTRYPVEFLAAILTCERDTTDKIAEYIRLGKERGIEIQPPDINTSEVDFSVSYTESAEHPEGRIVYGLAAIKGVGDAALGAIIETRKEDPFIDMFDFARRVDLSKVNRNVIESLIKAGALDITIDLTTYNRGHIFGVLDVALEQGKSAQRDRETGQTNLFGTLMPTSLSPDTGAVSAAPLYEGARHWSEREILTHEKASLGFFMSGHPMERYEKEATRLTGTTTLSIQSKTENEVVSVAGIVMDYSERTTKSGKRMGMGAIEDMLGRIDILVFAKALETVSPILRTPDPVLIKGKVLVDTKGEQQYRKISVQEAIPLHEMRSRGTREICLMLDAASFPTEQLEQLKQTLNRHSGRCDAFVSVHTQSATATLRLPEQLRLAPTDEMIQDVSSIPGITDVLFR